MKLRALLALSCSIALLFLSFELCNASEFRIKVVNARDGAITVNREVVGHVIYPTVNVNTDGFTASQWAGTSEIAATAVNAIHIKVANPKTIFSILPKEFVDNGKRNNSYFNSKSSIYTDVPAGKSIFGGGLSPFVGNKVIVNGAELSQPLKENDVIEIIVDRPQAWPKAIIFENKLGGKIYLENGSAESEVIGKVLKPVYGVGRFEGSLFLGPGRIRANHPGVIDISTSPSKMVGGFQIIPSNHAQSPEMRHARVSPQWMIVGNGSKEGDAPLFKYFLKPQYNSADIYEKDWEKRFLERFLVEVKLKGKDEWRPVPIYGLAPGEDLPDNAGYFLKNVGQIRILFPQNP